VQAQEKQRLLLLRQMINHFFCQITVPSWMGGQPWTWKNNISTYHWRKNSGPSSFNIVDANSVQTQVANLVQGIYQFELKVTDTGNLFGADTVKIEVNPKYYAIN